MCSSANCLVVSSDINEGRLWMSASGRIHWIRVLIAGVLAEASVFVVVIPVYRLSGQHARLYAAPAASLVMCFLFALGIGRRLESRVFLHALLVGAGSTLLRARLTLARPVPFAYLVARGLQLLGATRAALRAGLA